MSKLRAGYTLRKNGILQRQFTVNGKRYTGDGANYKECEAKELIKRERIKQGLTDNNNITLDTYFSEWEARRTGTVKPSTERRCYSNFIKNISPYIGQKRLRSLDRRDIFKLQQALKERGLKESTINMNLATLHNIIKGAVLDEIIPKNVCSSISTLKFSGKEARETIHRALKDDELIPFFEAARGFYYYRALKLMSLSGMRAGEVCALLESDIDLSAGIIHITKTITLSKKGYVIQTPKTKTSKRDIPINAQLKEVIKEQLKYNKNRPAAFSDTIGYLFPNPDGGFSTPTSLNITISRILDKLRRDGIDIEHFSSHAFRDTFATRAIEAGMKPETLQGILGHKNIGMTMNLYYHLSEEKKKTEMQMIRLPF